MIKEELQSSLEAHEQRMEDKNNGKAKAQITSQARFNEKDKRSKGKWTVKSKGNFHNFGGKESQSSKNLTCQRGESTCNINGRQGNFRVEKKSFDKSNERCFKCQRFDHFTRECNKNKKEPQGDESKVARRELDEDNTLLIMIIEGECSSNNNNSENATKTDCKWLHESVNRLHAEENVMMTVREGVQYIEEWYLYLGCSTHMTVRKD